MLARISAVQQMTGASRLTVASPVIMPTCSAPKIVAQREEFLVGQRLDRDGVIRTAALAEGLELERERDQRFAGAGGGVEDDVVAGEEFENGLFLMVVGFDFRGAEVVEEGVEDVVRGGVFG